MTLSVVEGLCVGAAPAVALLVALLFVTDIFRPTNSLCLSFKLVSSELGNSVILVQFLHRVVKQITGRTCTKFL